MRSRPVRHVAAAAGGLLVLPLGAAVPAFASTASTASTGWVVTATRAVPTTGLVSSGATPAATPLRIAVSIPLRDPQGLAQLIASHQTITPAQFDAAYAPSAASAQAVAGYLSSKGFGSVSVAPNRMLVTASGTAGAAESAFDTVLQNFSVSGRTAFANVTAASVPSALAGDVNSVVGLQDLGGMHVATNPPSSCVATGLGYPCTYNPQGFWKAYDATSAPTGSATPIAIFAEGDLTQVITDLRTEETANGLPQVPVTVVQTGPASTDTSGADEWDMDTQYSTGMAQSVSNLYLYDASSLSDPDITTEFNSFVTQDVAKAGSASFGECEALAQLDGSMAADDQIFAQAAAQGQTVFASAGDTGGFCPAGPAGVNGVPLGAPDVNYPASSPHVVAVGGTTLVTNSDGSYSQELAWLAGGGGPSLFESQPSWQAGLVPGVRNVPDIAMDADPNSGANVYVSGTPTGIGGTSLSSPLALGVWARIESAHSNSVGFASPLLYGASGSGAFHDIVLGDTGPYPALPGYDLATGIGTFDVAKAVSAIG